MRKGILMNLWQCEVLSRKNHKSCIYFISAFSHFPCSPKLTVHRLSTSPLYFQSHLWSLFCQIQGLILAFIYFISMSFDINGHFFVLETSFFLFVCFHISSRISNFLCFSFITLNTSFHRLFQASYLSVL